MKSYSISELSQEFDVTTRTLRFYEEKGLLAPMRKGQSRIYAARDRARLKLILRGKRLGLTLDESRDIILMYDSTSTNKRQMQALIKKIREKRMQLQQQLNDLEVMLVDLNGWEERCMAELGDQSVGKLA